MAIEVNRRYQSLTVVAIHRTATEDQQLTVDPKMFERMSDEANIRSNHLVLWWPKQVD